MSRRTTKQRRASRRRREDCEALRGWWVMCSGYIGRRARVFSDFVANCLPLPAARPSRKEGEP